MIKENRTASFIIVAIVYVIATIVGVASYLLLESVLHKFWLSLLISDVIATVVVFIASVIAKNASVYDPYWSVQPIVIVIAFAIGYGVNLASLLLIGVICYWGIRLTANWAYTFKSLMHQDWRYTMLNEKTGVFYPIINFVGIHLVPTLVVYLVTMPAVVAIVCAFEFNPLMIIGLCISVGATTMQMIADIQMQEYRKNKTTPFISVGLWKYSRHPNYLGEILNWYGVALAVIALCPSLWILIVGAVVNTCLFMFVSLPMAENRQSSKQGFDEYKKHTRLLLPIYKK